MPVTIIPAPVTGLTTVTAGTGSVSGSDFDRSASTYADVTGCSVTVTTGAIVFVGVSGNNGYAPGSACTGWYSYTVDGGADNQVLVVSGASGIGTNINWSAIITGLSPGSHTFKLRTKGDGTNVWRTQIGTTLAVYSIS